MGIGGISPMSGYSAFSGISGIYPTYNASAVSGVASVSPVSRGSDGTALGTVQGAKDVDATNASKRVQKGECQTCKNRKYVDGSNENNVSFKTPGHIDPGSSASVVMGHEKEHVANAVAEGMKPGKELVSATVTLHTSVCPECGRVYVSGGVTHTQMRTDSNTGMASNPYFKEMQKQGRMLGAGVNFDKGA